MDKDIKKGLDTFLDKKEVKKEIENKEENPVLPVLEKTGLVERIDKTLVLKDGRQLLNERYF